MLTQQRTDTTQLLASRALECAAMMLIGNGVVGLLEPRRHVQLWRNNVEPFHTVTESFVGRPGATLLQSAAKIAAGIWLASRQRR